MTDDKHAKANPPAATGGSIPNRILGSLREALAAASRDATGEITVGERTEILPKDRPQAAKLAAPPPPPAAAPSPPAPQLSTAEAVREAKTPGRVHYEAAEPTTRVVRGKGGEASPLAAGPAKTQVVRGRPKVARASFEQDPVVGWLVVVCGPGLGAFRPIYEGNNAVGRGSDQRIPIDFGDNTISSAEQAYIRYDSMDRSFLFVPNLSKTNVVAVNNKKPTGAVKLEHMDVITMGRTQLAFVPFCGEEFDWSELSGLEE
jgi:FHA domain